MDNSSVKNIIKRFNNRVNCYFKRGMIRIITIDNCNNKELLTVLFIVTFVMVVVRLQMSSLYNCNYICKELTNLHC